jgi:dipeptide transport system ATP-binding protein
VEKASREELFSDPRHPYTRALLSATPIPDPTREKTREVLKGELPSPINPPTGCAFHPRCPKVFDPCASKTPLLVGPDSRKVACHLYND